MRYISIIEDKMYLLWQQEVQIKNLEELGELEKLTVVVLYNGETPSVYSLTLAQYPCEVFFFKKPPESDSYSPANKPYGLMKYLELKGASELFMIDSDVIFKDVQNISQFVSPQTWYMSDCEGYLGFKYMRQHLSKEQLEGLLSVVGLTLDDVSDSYVGGGAQYYFKSIDATIAREVYEACFPLYKFLGATETKIQIWTAEMWAWLFIGLKHGKVLKTARVLDFCWATDPVTMWDSKNILHLAGVTSKESGHFYKGDYTRKQPWFKLNFDYITNQKACSWIYFTKMKGYFSIQE